MRAFSITRRLHDLGYESRDMHGVWKEKGVNTSAALTDKCTYLDLLREYLAYIDLLSSAWDALLPKLRDIVDKARDSRLDSERLCDEHYFDSDLQQAYARLVTSGAVRPQDVPYLPHFRAFAQFVERFPDELTNRKSK